MGDLFHTPRPNAFQQPQALGVDLNSSNYGKPIPVVYGKNKIAGNCVWYGDFKVKQTQQGGKGGGGGVTSYDYHASYMLVICEGPIASFGNVWQGSSDQPLSDLDPAFTALGAIGQSPWSHFGGTQAIGYSGWSLVAFLNNDLGGQAQTPNYQFEVNGLEQFAGGEDANPSDVLKDICANVYHGIGFDWLGDLTQWSDYCVANSLFISPTYNQESTAASVFSDLLSWTNSAAYFSEGQLKITPYGDTTVTGNGVTFTPDLTPVYSFTDADYVVDDASSPPINVTRKALADVSNTIRIQYSDRSYYYYSMMVEARDENDAITNGVRAHTSENISAITNAQVARFVAQNKLQREMFIRNTYEWKTSWKAGYLEPTDLVTITDSTMGFNNLLVRITQVSESEDGSLSITAEEFPVGVGHSENYGTQSPDGAVLNVLEDPGPVDTPVFFRAPGFITPRDNPMIGVALSGGDKWGGCQVFLSYDGDNYFFKTSWQLQSRYGVLGAGGLASGADPDTSHSPTVTLEQGELVGGSNAEADQLQTLFMVDTELCSYGTATLVSGEEYTLSYLRRGAYNTAIASHAAGATFIRLDDTVLYLPIDPSFIGETIYVKFLSFNRFGKTPRTLSDESAHTYVVGTNTNLLDVPDTPTSFSVTAVADGCSLNWSLDNPAAVAVVSIERSTDDATWSVLGQVGAATTTYHDGFTSGDTFYYRLRARGALPQAGWSDYTASIDSTGKTVQNGADVTGNNTANDTKHVNKVASAGISPIADLMPAEANADNTLNQSYSVVGNGSNVVPNSGFESNVTGSPFNSPIAVGADVSDGWKVIKNENSVYSVELQNHSARSGTNCAVILINQGSVIPNTQTLQAEVQLKKQIPCKDGDIVSMLGYGFWYQSGVTLPTGVTAFILMQFYFRNAAGGSLGEEYVLYSSPASDYQPFSKTATAPAGTAYIEASFSASITNESGSTYTVPSTGDLLGCLFDDFFISINDPRQPNSAKAYIDFGDATSGGHSARGSIPPVTPSAGFTYTSTTSSITISWVAATLYYPDGTTTSVSSGSTEYSGLSDSSGYYFYPYYSLSGAAVLFAGGANTGPSTANLVTQTSLNNIPLSSGALEFVTGAGGSGGNGAPGSCLHPDTDILVQGPTQEEMIKAADLQAGPHQLWTPDGWQPILNTKRLPRTEWIQVELSNQEVVTVTPEHVFRTANKKRIRACNLKLNKILDADKKLVSVTGLKIIQENSDCVALEIPRHWFYLAHGGVLHHNLLPTK